MEMIALQHYAKWKSWSNTNFGYCDPSLSAAYQSILKTVSLKQGDLALDFGFGNGEMLSVLRELKLNVLGIEVNNELILRAQSDGYPASKSIRAIPNIKPASIKLITAFHCLEHLDSKQLIDTFRDFDEFLMPGGFIIAAFPNGDSPFSGPSFTGDLTHRTLIGSSMANQLGNIVNFKLTKYTRFPAPSAFSRSLKASLLSRLRIVIEFMVNSTLSFIYYGNNRVDMSPIVYAVWTKNY